MIVKDHTGAEFPSLTAMCRAWGVSRNTFSGRRARGMTLEEALTSPPKVSHHGRACRDHLGNEFASVKAMCHAWGVSRKAYDHRVSRGASTQEALTGQVRRRLPATCKPCRDHLGREFPSKVAMCRHWGVEWGTFRHRMRAGWGLERALTGSPSKGAPLSRPCRDHLGREFPSIAAMCRAWDVSYPTYSYRMASGWDLERALTTRPRKEGAA